MTEFNWTPDIRLSPKARQALRTAVREHPSLDETTRGSVHLMSKDDLLDAANKLGLDPAKVFSPEMVEALIPDAPAVSDSAVGVVVSDAAVQTQPREWSAVVQSSDDDPASRAAELASEALSMPVTDLRDTLVSLYTERLTPRPAMVAQSSAVSGPAPAVTYHKVGSRKVGELFGVTLLDGTGKPMQADVYNCPDAPQRNPNWIWDEAVLRALVLASTVHAPAWLHGMPGTGKTQAAVQFAAITGRPLVRINLDGTSERFEWFGGERMKGGDVVWTDGALIAALRMPGCVILLDEPTTGRPDNLSALHPVLEAGGRITIAETGEVLYPAPGVMFVAADNTAGTGDDSGLFAGTREMNRAMLSRFATVVAVDYLSRKNEAALLKNETGCPEPLALSVVDMASKLRAKVRDGALDYPPGPRELVAWIRNLQAGFPPKQAYLMAIGKGQSAAGREVATAVFDASIPDERVFTSQLRGEAFEADLL